jgi:hypothetical protein
MPSRKRSDELRLGAGQAEYVLNRLIADRQITRWQVQGVLSQMDREIQELEQRLASLRNVAVGGTPMKRGPGRPRKNPLMNGTPARADKAGRRKRSLSAETRASYALQGQYLGYIRQFPATQKEKYKKLAKEKGREVAISEMRKALKR